MPAPKNKFKDALKDGRVQVGLWLALANPYTAELLGEAGFDWVLIDGEHGPNDIPLIMQQLQALKGADSHPVVRLPVAESWMIKQALDIGAQSLLIPMIESEEKAQEMVRAVRYPPAGVRGVGAALARASNFGRIPDYLPSAGSEISLLLQIESVTGIENLDAIAAVEGVDGIFIGPADLAASMGHLGAPGAEPVVKVVEDAIRRVRRAGKAAGVLTSDLKLANRYMELGATFIAIGSDVGILVAGAQNLRAGFGSVSAG